MFPICFNRRLFFILLVSVQLFGIVEVGSGAAQTESRKSIQTTGKSGQTYRSLTINEDTTLHGDVVIEGIATVASHATLTILPGTVLHFRSLGQTGATDSGLLIQGRLVASGTAEKPIVFTGTFVNAEPGDWQGIIFLASEKKNILEHCRVEGGVIGIDAAYSSLTLKNTTFVKCVTGARMQDTLVFISGGGASGCGLGLKIADCEADIRDASYSSNRQGIMALRSSLYLSGATLYSNESEALIAEKCKLKILASSFTLNGNGINLVACEGGVANSRFLKNHDNGLMLAKSKIKVSQNEIAQNGRIGLRVEDGYGIAWGNTFAANGTYDLYNAGTEEFRALANWWGGLAAAEVGARIYDNRNNKERGRVVFQPLLPKKPQTGM